MPDERRRPLSASLRRILDRGKETPSPPGSSQPGEPPAPEPVAPPSTALDGLSLLELLRYVRVLAGAAVVQASELREAQAEVDRRLVDAQQDADIESLQDAARRLQRRRLQLDAEGDDRLLRPPPRRRPPNDDRWGGGGGGLCMCSIPAPSDDKP
jgi:hypothetical protein